MLFLLSLGLFLIFAGIMQKAFSYIQHSLQAIYSETEIKQISYLLIEKLSGFSPTEIITSKNTLFSLEQQKQLRAFVENLKKNIPIQYIIGETEFYGLKFEVNADVLIPRPETEELVEWISSENKQTKKANLLDIGTGTGCIAISLKKELPSWEVDAFDISEKALSTARKNANLNNTTIKFEQVDILQAKPIDKQWDIIVSNPPYIPEKQKAFMDANVLDHEPHGALFVPDEDPLLFYRTIALFAQKHLKEKGKLFFEIHYDAAEEIKNLLENLEFKSIKIKKDISGNDRMVCGNK